MTQAPTRAGMSVPLFISDFADTDEADTSSPTEVFAVLPTPPGWWIASADEDTCELHPGLFPVIAWAATREGMIPLEPGKPAWIAADIWRKGHAALIDPDGKVIGYDGQHYKTLAAWLKAHAERRERIREAIKKRTAAKTPTPNN
jgi:hypothetical protein